MVAFVKRVNWSSFSTSRQIQTTSSMHLGLFPRYFEVVYIRVYI